ncbi:MAG: hypothetical protein KF767_15890 [Bdellovibrionaceae bacterium]|nr:hypothetical protein [Pseudobdellovibrionaceae bacterium]
MKPLLVIFIVLLGTLKLQAQDVNYDVAESDTRGIDLTVYGPSRADRIRTLLRTPNESYGPNCWNAALQVSGVIDSTPRYVSGAEFWHWMNSPFCAPVGRDEPLRYGDIGSVFSAGQGHYHSFMRVNDNVIFQKAGPEVHQKWEYTKHEKIVFPQFFNEAQKCKGNEAKQQGKDCELGIVYHRCDAVPNDFYSKHGELRGAEAEIKKQEAIIAKWMKHRRPADRPAFEAAMFKMKNVMDRLGKQTFTGEKEFARRSLHLRAAANLVTDIYQDDEKKSLKLLQVQDEAVAFFQAQERRTAYASVDRTTWRTFAWPNRPSQESGNQTRAKSLTQGLDMIPGYETPSIRELLEGK